MLPLKEVFPGAVPESALDLPITDVTADSRQVGPGSLFFAIRGAKLDGKAFLPDAIAAGAAAVVLEAGEQFAETELSVPLLRTDNVRRDYAASCVRLFDAPSAKLQCIGVTGTNGKTSVSWILSHALSALGKSSALCGTLGKKVPILSDSDFEPLANTSPDPRIIQSFLREALDFNCKSAVLEVTSQGVVQHRTDGVEWDVGIFTNLSRDHLDVHGTMENYATTKLQFFRDELGRSAKRARVAILNVDDAVGRTYLQTLRAELPQIRCVSFSVEAEADCRAFDLNSSMDETSFRAELFGQQAHIRSKLVGAFNVANLLAAASCLSAIGYSVQDIETALFTVPPVPGRLEVIPAGEFHAVIDYAHTPDGLIQAQRSLRPLTKGRLITVFGCGGDRDRGKRPLMGEAVAELADIGVVTSDNPRTEDPERIIADILPGLEKARHERFETHQLTDRREAITWAIRSAKKGDVVLVAGKGHEDYQEVGVERFPFSDQNICRGIIEGKL